MKALVFILTLVLATAYIGCGDKKQAVHENTRTAGDQPRGGPALTSPAGPAAQVPTNSQVGVNPNWGQITPQSGSILTNQNSEQMNDNDVSRAFLITNFNPNYVGATTNDPDPVYQLPCSSGQRCVVGLSLGTDQNSSHNPLVTQSNQTISQMMSSNSAITVTSGGITMGFWDSLTGTKANTDDQHIITPIPVYIPIDSSSSTITGSHIVLNFRDVLGLVTLDGTANSSTYQGTITFTNLNDYANSGATTKGQLGSFIINTCAAFRCN